MSEFDKEAERQKLREKYERDQKKRQSTQRMSELLLKGATMTNRHCDECGDPIFRYDGEEFCPTCQNAQVAGGQEAEAESGATEPTESAGQAATTEGSATGEANTENGAGVESEVDTGSDDVDVAVQTAESTADETTESTSKVSTAPSTAGVSTRQPSTESQLPNSSAENQSPTGSAESQSSQGPAERAAQPAGSTGSGDLADARASLQRSVVRFAQQAENADNPRRAKELLSASREAAEALAALNR